MKLVGKKELAEFVQKLHGRVPEVTDLVLVGGSAVLALASRAKATRDIDVLWTDGLSAVRDALGPDQWDEFCSTCQLSTRSDPFEVYLPPDWHDRARLSESLSTSRVRVFTPAPEDLASMKVFRLRAKDSEDIERLARSPGFDPAAFKRAFCETLPFAIGKPQWHAQSFCMAWNALYPEALVQPEEILPDEV